jgi:predicted O-linked N-acetylglucosamine transferase (SPINDLY family)
MFKWMKNILPGAADASAASGAAAEAAVHRSRGNAFLDQANWEQAAGCYRQAISIDPRDLNAHINLGFALSQQRRGEEAQGVLERALELDPQSVDAHYMLGVIEQEAGQHAAAVARFGKALALKPDFEMAYHGMCQGLFRSGQTERAREVTRRAIAQFPQAADFHFYLGNLHGQAEEWNEAIPCFRQVLALKPDHAEAHNKLGFALQADGNPEQAMAAWRQAIAARPDYAEAWCNLGNVLQQQDRIDEAIDHYHNAVRFDPDKAEFHSTLGNALRVRGRLDEAVASCKTALRLNPAYAAAHLNLGLTLHQQGKHDEAIGHYRQALAIRPDDPVIHNNLGNALQLKGNLVAAMEHYRSALALDPGYADAYSNLGGAQLAAASLNAAIESYRRALAIRPDFLEGHSNLLFALTFAPDQGLAYVEEARRYGAKVAAQAVPYTAWKARRPAEGPLRVGLVSGDLNAHPVSFFLENIVAQLDKAKIELVAYPTQAHEDDMTARLKQHFAQWTPLTGLSDQAAAERIHADGIHILIDLAGHTAHNRLPVFGWKPAPVQVSWLGYWASTGVPGMDYLLADLASAPDAQRDQFTETVWRLPDTRFCFTAPAARIEVTSLPALRNGHVTFGSFQNMAKLDDAALALWGRVLRSMPTARLRLQSKQMGEPDARSSLQQRLARSGIAAERVDLAGPANREQYLAAHSEVDIILDSFPFPGGTTTCEALWMGVPTLTLAGNTLVSRQGVSLLSCAGLADWIAQDQDEYVAKALAHGAGLDRLAQLRAGLRQQVMNSPLFDAPRFARHLEQALYGMLDQRHV